MAVLLVASPACICSGRSYSGRGESYIQSYFCCWRNDCGRFGNWFGAVGAGAGIGTAANGACGAVGRNPGVQGKIMMTMLVGMAMAESIAIYALVVSLVLLYANPYMRYFLG